MHLPRLWTLCKERKSWLVWDSESLCLNAWAYTLSLSCCQKSGFLNNIFYPPLAASAAAKLTLYRAGCLLRRGLERPCLVPAYSQTPPTSVKYFNYRKCFYVPYIIVKTLKQHFRANKIQRRLWPCVELCGVTCGRHLSHWKQSETPGKLGHKEHLSEGPRELPGCWKFPGEMVEGREGQPGSCAAAPAPRGSAWPPRLQRRWSAAVWQLKDRGQWDFKKIGGHQAISLRELSSQRVGIVCIKGTRELSKFANKKANIQQSMCFCKPAKTIR